MEAVDRSCLWETTPPLSPCYLCPLSLKQKRKPALENLVAGK